MKITIRIPTEQFAYAEVQFDSIEEYQEKYPEFAKAMITTRAKAKKVQEEFSQPF